VSLALFVFTITLIPLPISPLLVLVIDLMADVFPAIAFAYEPAEIDLMSLPPRTMAMKRMHPEPSVSPYRAERRPHASESTFHRVWESFLGGYKDPVSGDSLVNHSMLRWAFLRVGLINTFGAFGSYLVGLAVARVPFSILWNSSLVYWKSDSPPLALANGTIANGHAQVEILRTLNTGFFISVMIVQWFNGLVVGRYMYPNEQNARVPEEQRKGFLRDAWNRYGYSHNPRMWIYFLISLIVVGVVSFVPAIDTVFLASPIYALQIVPPLVAGFVLLAWYVLKMKWMLSRSKSPRGPQSV
jgi:magnesium-transporting ATPase (P-type)